MARFLRDRAVVVLIAALILVCWILTFRGGHDWGGDFSQYIAHAGNLISGKPYSQINLLIDPESAPQSPPSYPPFFPLVIAPVYAVAGLNYVVLKIYVQMLWLAAGVLYFILGRQRGLPGTASALAVAVFLLSSFVLSAKDSVISESTFLVVTGLFFLLSDLIYKRKYDETRPLLYGSLQGLLMLAAYLTRVNGLMLIVAFGLFDLWRVRRIRVFSLSAGLVFTIGFVVYSLGSSGSGYGNQFRFAITTYANNVVAYLKTPAALWGSLPAALRYPAAFTVLVLTVTGFIRSLLNRPSVLEPAVVLSLLPLIPYHASNTRYILPLFPLFLLYSAETLVWLFGLLQAPARRFGLAVASVLLVAGAIWNVRDAMRAPIPDGPDTPAFQAAANWIRQNTDRQDVLVSWNPRVFALYTGRPSSFYVFTHDRQKFDGFLSRIHANWIITYNRSEEDKEWVVPQIAERVERFTPVWSDEVFRIYKVIH